MVGVSFLLLSTLLWAAQAQMQSPFLGQGIPLNNTDVYVTVGLDRLIGVDDEAYRFQAMLMVILNWRDPRAYAAVQSSTESYLTTGACGLYCTNMKVPGSTPQRCCDNSSLWLPDLEFMNAWGFPQDRVDRYSITVDQNNAVSWWATVQADFFTNLEFKAFPFDQQQLIVQVSYVDDTPDINVNFIASSVALTTFLPRAGDDISGWKISNLTVVPFVLSTQQVGARTRISNGNDPVPIHPVSGSNYSRLFYNPLWSKGFTVIIGIERISMYYILTAIVPICLNVWLALLCFSISPKHLDTRLGVLVTLFLSLTALMLVVGSTLPRSSVVVPTQQLSLLSFCVLAFVGLESIIVYKLITIEKQDAIRERTTRAKQEFYAKWRNSLIERGKLDPNEKDSGSCCGGGVGGGATSKWLSSCCGLRRRRQKSEAGEADAVAVNGSSRGTGAAAIAVEMEGLHSQRSAGEIGAVVRKTDTMVTVDHMPIGAFQRGSSSGSGSDDGDDDGRSGGSDGVGGPRGLRRMPSMHHRSIKAAAMWDEIRHNPDYALHVALKIDRIVFWFTLILYNVGMVLILALNASYVPAITY